MKCICCEKNIVKPYDDNMIEEDYIWSTKFFEDIQSHERAEDRLWRNGIVANITSGYGSRHDGEIYVIAICDNCITKKSSDGIIAYTEDFLTHQSNAIQESKILWRRDQNLDKLI